MSTPAFVTARAVVEDLRRARRRLDLPSVRPDDVEAKRRVVEAAAERLARTAMNADCPVQLTLLLLDWRDRLGSFVLAASAVTDLDVHADVAERLLRRGLDEVIEQAPDRLVGLDAGGVKVLAADGSSR
jgi:hypothetical protein